MDISLLDNNTYHLKCAIDIIKYSEVQRDIEKIMFIIIHINVWGWEKGKYTEEIFSFNMITDKPWDFLCWMTVRVPKLFKIVPFKSMCMDVCGKYVQHC